MNPITLKFLDQEIEAKFQKANEDKFKSQAKWLILSMLISGGISTIMEGVNQNYLTFGLYVGFLLLFLFIFLAIEKNSEFALKVIKMFNNVNFSVPAMNLLFSMYNLIEWQTGIAFILLTILYAPLYNSSYNIIQDAIFIVIVSSISIGHISYLIGFTPYYFVIIGPLIQLIYQRYSSIKVERLIFSQSLVNTSLVEVVTKVCKENIIIFTYNFEQKNYEKEIINETAQSYFNTDILGDILKEIHIKNETDISSFVFRNCIQQSKRGQLELKGYYKSKTNKILINLYVTQYENIQIILKIQNKYNKMIKIKKAKKFIIFQFQFLQNLLKKFRDKFRIKDRVSQNSEFYDYLRKSLIYNKIQIIQIAKQAQMKIENINLDQMIEYIFSSWNIKYLTNSNLNDLPVFLDENQIQNNKGKIQSSSMILELILNVVAIYLRQVVQDHQQFILIELTQISEQKILLNFHFIQKPQRKSISFVQSSLIKLLSFVGMQDSVEFQENTLSFTVLKQVDQAFEIKNK